MENSYCYFKNEKCEYFPCHKEMEDFNCLFCYCPLYSLGEACGGCYEYTAGGIKDCSGCTLPHRKENYDLVLSRIGNKEE